MAEIAVIQDRRQTLKEDWGMVRGGVDGLCLEILNMGPCDHPYDDMKVNTHTHTYTQKKPYDDSKGPRRSCDSAQWRRASSPYSWRHSVARCSICPAHRYMCHVPEAQTLGYHTVPDRVEHRPMCLAATIK